MKIPSYKTQSQEPMIFEIDRVQSTFMIAAVSAGRVNLSHSWATYLWVAGIVAVVLVLLASVVYTIWSRLLLKPQSEKAKEENQRKMDSGFGGLLKETWGLYLLVVGFLVVLRLIIEVQNVFLPAFWSYVALNLGQALFYGVIASIFSWMVTRRLVAAPLVSTS